MHANRLFWSYLSNSGVKQPGIHIYITCSIFEKMKCLLQLARGARIDLTQRKIFLDQTACICLASSIFFSVDSFKNLITSPCNLHLLQFLVQLCRSSSKVHSTKLQPNIHVPSVKSYSVTYTWIVSQLAGIFSRTESTAF